MTEVVIGKIEKIYTPREFNGKLSPGKIILDTDEGQAVVSVWQVYEDSVRTDKMPSLWNNLDFEWSIDKTVAISCKFDKIYESPTTGMVQHQYSKMSAIKFIGAEPPKQVETKPVARTASQPPKPTSTPSPVPHIDENQMRIMRQSTLKVSGGQLNQQYFDTNEDLILQSIENAEVYLEWVITGKKPSFTTATEPEEEEIIELTYLNDEDEADSVIGEI